MIQIWWKLLASRSGPSTPYNNPMNRLSCSGSKKTMFMGIDHTKQSQSGNELLVGTLIFRTQLLYIIRRL
jgi:hypothetical protein